ncbi:exonuclease SbcCD subunit D C-terminal domain-containing protein [Duganella sp. LX20W]|uniref:Nuclease SbcCD subunit D n=1 Tax=Rugamonas brunnea TaxID=2758569 RepID=A0A7W2ENB7_9BURK|nr:exonuclease SbcCD subunit D C-terminal domain-containing protein [Rugamonas brunnea]MBA5635656.1 exonuclease SbcCD subunit D C-terminal domain-containing protein [Rugamonas brunnea]
MRLLHTSDWHLGQSLHNFDRAYEHQCFLDWLLDTLVAQQVDALLIAGDVFDNANPSAASQHQLYRFLRQASERVPHLNLIVIAGNHDSPGRLEAPGPLLEAHGTRVVGSVRRGADGEIDLEQLVLPLTDRDGAVRAWCLAVPFLRPGDVPRVSAAAGTREADDVRAAESGDTGTMGSGSTETAAAGDAGAAEAPAPEQQQAGDPYLAGIALLYQQALALAEARRQPGQAIVAMGHCHMVDGQMSNDSERRIVIGGTEMLPAGIFGPAIAYAALGHLHLAQAVGKQQHIRYCGSPIPLSFAEVGYQHQVLLIDVADEQVSAITPLPAPRAVPLLRIPAKPAPLAQVLEELAALAPAPAEPHAQPLLEVRVLLDAPEPGLRARIEEALDGKPVRLAKIETSSAAREASQHDPAMTLDQLAQLKPDDIFKRLYAQKFGNDAPADQLSAFAELMLPGA